MMGGGLKGRMLIKTRRNTATEDITRTKNVGENRGGGRGGLRRDCEGGRRMVTNS
jgi:hypothetical protein